jgi:hypothetical protein
MNSLEIDLVTGERDPRSRRPLTVNRVQTKSPFGLSYVELDSQTASDFGNYHHHHSRPIWFFAGGPFENRLRRLGFPSHLTQLFRAPVIIPEYTGSDVGTCNKQTALDRMKNASGEHFGWNKIGYPIAQKVLNDYSEFAQVTIAHSYGIVPLLCSLCVISSGDYTPLDPRGKTLFLLEPYWPIPDILVDETERERYGYSDEVLDTPDGPFQVFSPANFNTNIKRFFERVVIVFAGGFRNPTCVKMQAMEFWKDVGPIYRIPNVSHGLGITGLDVYAHYGGDYDAAQEPLDMLFHILKH